VPNSLLIVHVDIAVVPESLDAFLQATEANASASREEPGILRFDLLTDRADPAHHVLVEIYRDDAAVAAHRETAHYEIWRDTVEPMMARQRVRTSFVNASPDDDDW
jgi:autoinducer 2-degrading protein